MSSKSVALGFAALAAAAVAGAAGAGQAQAAPQTHSFSGLSLSACQSKVADARRAGAVAAVCLPDGTNTYKAVIVHR
ncbi:hypothetical protein NDR87_09340 [Nocardia sp. CDC159]|uniref:Uncharacterized protein n=1 Tax=Nocardia pulmonis TaxID=2951408 RepID=A0A9X2E8I7_9NOCA|nr:MULTISPECIES: hypothetical protein [Nocardia]MCM6773671.1 hypothetical protein [Nocardia pulmonis]MCM6786558.1 hypothetical protein [Nocardia sp. CDC159]